MLHVTFNNFNLCIKIYILIYIQSKLNALNAKRRAKYLITGVKCMYYNQLLFYKPIIITRYLMRSRNRIILEGQ